MLLLYMSAELLAKLQIKNTPKIKDTVTVKIPAQKETVEINQTITDLRKERDFNREEFLSKIKNALPIKPAQRIEPVPVPGPVPEPVPVPVSGPVPVQIKPKKLKKKLKLVDEVNIQTEQTKRASPIVETRILQENLIIPILERVPPKQPNIQIKASSYYMDNREIFNNFINSLFAPYKQELKETAETMSCESRSEEDFSLMAHQKIVKDYLNLYTPYRGLLLYHGLGSGKTCSSIAIAEGMKDAKKIIVMSPASLRRNYYEELKKCGDTMYKKNQFWEFVVATKENIPSLSTALNLSVDYINKQGGAWLINLKKKPNYSSLNSADKENLEKQLDEMIRYKYQFISYNGLRRSHMRNLTKGANGKINPFDNAAVVIDEVHNLVSRIVNKQGRSSADSVSLELYELLMTAENVKIILLSGTPIINYPNEIAILFNIIRGYIKTWTFKLTINTERKVTKQTFEDIFKSTVLGGNVADYIDYNSSNTTLSITRNPYGFVNKTTKGKYEGVRVAERGEMTDAVFVGHVTRLLTASKMKIINTKVELFKALPDKLDDFKSYFINSDNDVQNMNMFKRRILGLASYFRSAQEGLMPRYTKSSNFYIVDVEMSDFQFSVYEEARAQERKIETNNARKKKRAGGADIYEETVSTYRIFSRAFCNFVFPKPTITRPMPEKIGSEMDMDEDALDTSSKLDNLDGKYEADELEQVNVDIDKNYDERIKNALRLLTENREKFLTGDALNTYSPKFNTILENIKNPDHKGLHLVYSQFRTLEGIGIFKIVLEANGFTEFKLINTAAGGWRLDIPIADRGKPMFALYTGTENAEQKEIIRNVFNGDWKYIPQTLEEDILSISSNNLYGEVIKVFMITASGAEGISLKNTRYVHIMEPYWHPVRIQQVVGRARRICSHQELPEELRTVDVFLYLMQFSEKQLTSDATIELRLKDTSKRDGTTPLTSDQALWEIATLKEEVTEKILESVKEASIDCSLHSTLSSEKLKCFSFGTPGPDDFAYSGSYSNEEFDRVAEQNKKQVELRAEEVKIQGIKYAIVKSTGDIYDWDSYMLGRPIQIGKLIQTQKGFEFQRL